jgi:cytochrome c oxidase assembly factor CtaG
VVIPWRPQRPRLGYALRAIYVGVAGAWASMIGALFMFTVAPFYPQYGAPASPSVAAALVDQHLAGAVLDIPGVTVFFVAMSTLLYLWLREDERQGAAPSMESPKGTARVS